MSAQLRGIHSEGGVMFEQRQQPMMPVGKVMVTGHAHAILPREEINEALNRHRMGDWGDLPPDERQINEKALKTGEEIVSLYESKAGAVFCITTSGDRKETEISVPGCY